MKEGYIKGDRTKHILPKFFFTHDLQRNGDVEIQKIRACENLTDLFTKSLSRRTFEQLVHRIGLRHLNDLYRMMYSFSFTRFSSQRVFPSKVLMRHILYQWTPEGECYELMVVLWFITINHMIDSHIIHYSLCNILYLLFDFISFFGYHVVSINRTRPISNKTHIQTEVAPYSHILYSSSHLSLSYYLYFITITKFYFILKIIKNYHYINLIYRRKNMKVYKSK